MDHRGGSIGDYWRRDGAAGGVWVYDVAWWINSTVVCRDRLTDSKTTAVLEIPSCFVNLAVIALELVFSPTPFMPWRSGGGIVWVVVVVGRVWTNWHLRNPSLGVTSLPNLLVPGSSKAARMRLFPSSRWSGIANGYIQQAPGWV